MREKTYSIKECFYSLQGEGIRAGEPSVFLRFAGCNLDCKIATHGFDCDTDFAKGEKYTLAQTVQLVRTVAGPCRWVIFTGGEPALQLDRKLIDALHGIGFRVAIETNGTKRLDYEAELDWICVSPKVTDDQVRQLRADEVKFVLRRGDPIPHTAIVARYYLVSPAFNVVDKAALTGTADFETLQWCIGLCLENPKWRLSCQQHKSWSVR